MNMLANLATDDSIADEKDFVGGSGLFDTAVYPFTVALAYLTKSDGEALALNVHLKTEDGRELRQQLWMTSGKAKGCKNYYEKNGEKHYLPGFLLANSLCLLTVGKEIGQLDTEQKVVALYSYDAKAEVPTKVDMLTDLIGQDIHAAVFKQTVDKNVKNDAGIYVASGETRDENEIDKFFRSKDKLTTAEIRAKVEEATFINTWTEKHAGKVKVKAKGASANAGTAGAPAAQAAASTKPKTSLFG